MWKTVTAEFGTEFIKYLYTIEVKYFLKNTFKYIHKIFRTNTISLYELLMSI